MPKVLEVDSRKRVSLGTLAQHDLYMVNVLENGEIVLTPAVVIPAALASLRHTPYTEEREDSRGH